MSVGIDISSFGGVPTSRIVAALAAEGAPIFLPHQPVYRSPLWRSGALEAKYAANQPDFVLNLDAVCDVAERVSGYEGVVIAHEVFLGENSDARLICDAIDKVQRGADEIPLDIIDTRSI